MVSRLAQRMQKHVAGLLQGSLRPCEEGQESVEAFINRLVARLDEAIGVEDQSVTGVQSDCGGVEGDLADAERGAGRQVEQFGGRPGRTRAGGRCPALEMRHWLWWGS